MSIPNAMITPRTSTTEPPRTHSITSKRAGRTTTSPRRLHANCQTRIEVVTRGATTLEASHGVLTSSVSTRVGSWTIAFVHVNALVVVEVELEALGTTTLVGSGFVEAAFLASGVVVAFIHVNAEGARLIQLKSSGTHALEAAVGVLACSGWRT